MRVVDWRIGSGKPLCDELFLGLNFVLFGDPISEGVLGRVTVFGLGIVGESDRLPAVACLGWGFLYTTGNLLLR